MSLYWPIDYKDYEISVLKEIEHIHSHLSKYQKNCHPVNLIYALGENLPLVVNRNVNSLYLPENFSGIPLEVQNVRSSGYIKGKYVTIQMVKIITIEGLWYLGFLNGECVYNFSPRETIQMYG